MRVLLGDRTGAIKAELSRGALGNVEWRLNSAGSATLQVQRNAPEFQLELLEPGARIYAEFDDGLPAWGGVLDLPREWSPGMVQMKVWTIERLLKAVTTAKVRGFYGTVVGSIFVEVLQEAERKAGLGLTLGQVWWGGAPHYPRYHARDLMWVIDSSIRKMETCDYRFTAYLDQNQIRFRAELHEQLGDDKRARVMLVEGVNVAEARLTEQGEIINRVAVVGSGATWGEREVVYGIEEESRRRYGLREMTLTPADVSQTVTLNRYADTAIRERAYPHVMATLEMVDTAPALFADYDVGDIVRVKLPSYGFDGYDAPMRILARGYDPRTRKCQVVCDERFAYDPVIQGEDETEPGGDADA